VRDALEAIYREHRQGLFTLALSITRRGDRAEDAVHDAFARLCRGTTQPAGDPVAYVYATVRNAAIDIIRSRTEPAVDTSAGALAGSGGEQGHWAGGSGAGQSTGAVTVSGRLSIYNGYDPALSEGATVAIAAETEQIVRDAVDNLPDPQRNILVIKLYGALTFDQIAQSRGEPLSTVASRYRRALGKLKSKLEKVVQP